MTFSEGVEHSVFFVSHPEQQQCPFDFLLILQDEKEQLIQSKSSVASLVGRSKTIVQLKPRNPDHVLKSTICVKAICDYRQIEVRREGRREAFGQGYANEERSNTRVFNIQNLNKILSLGSLQQPPQPVHSLFYHQHDHLETSVTLCVSPTTIPPFFVERLNSLTWLQGPE